MAETRPIDQSVQNQTIEAPPGVRYDEVEGVFEPTAPEAPTREEGASFTSLPTASEALAETVQTDDQCVAPKVFSPKSEAIDPSLYVCADTRTPEGVAIASAQYASGDPELQAAAVEALRDSDALAMCFDPTLPENEVFMVAQAMSTRDIGGVEARTVRSEGQAALQYLMANNPEARERLESLACELEETGGGFEQAAAEVIREVIEVVAQADAGADGLEEVAVTMVDESSTITETASIETSAPEGRMVFVCSGHEPVSVDFVQEPVAQPIEGRDEGSDNEITFTESHSPVFGPSIFRFQPSSSVAHHERGPLAYSVMLNPRNEIELRGWLGAVAQMGALPQASGETAIRAHRFFSALPTNNEGRSQIAQAILAALASLANSHISEGETPSEQVPGDAEGYRFRMTWNPRQRRLDAGLIPPEDERETEAMGSQLPTARRGKFAVPTGVGKGLFRGNGFFGEGIMEGPVFAPVDPALFGFRNRSIASLLGRGITSSQKDGSGSGIAEVQEDSHAGTHYGEDGNFGDSGHDQGHDENPGDEGEDSDDTLA